MPEIAVLIPCYNEAQTVAKVVSDFRAALPEAVIYVYDNASTDDTFEIARAAGAVVRREYRRGKGNVIRSMFRDVEADCYIMADGDDTYPAEYAPEMAALVLGGEADMVVGDRLSSTYFTENKRRFHNGGNVLVRALVNRIFGSDVTDIMSGYRAFSRLFVKSYPVIHKGFEIETDMTVFALDKNLLVRSAPVKYRDRPEGSVSKLSTVSDGMRVLKTIFQLFKDYRPLPFFGLAALILFLAGAAVFATVLADYFRTGLVLRFPSMITALVVIVAAVQTLCCGLTLDTEAKNNRRTYELHFTRVSMERKSKEE